MMKSNKERKYYRICPYCGKRFEQSDMVRTDLSKTGWMCKDCFDETLDPCWDIGEEF